MCNYKCSPLCHHCLLPWYFTSTIGCCSPLYTPSLLNRRISIHQTRIRRTKGSWIPNSISMSAANDSMRLANLRLPCWMRICSTADVQDRDSERKLFLKSVEVAGIACSNHVSSWRIAGLKWNIWLVGKTSIRGSHVWTASIQDIPERNPQVLPGIVSFRIHRNCSYIVSNRIFVQTLHQQHRRNFAY